MSTASNGAWAVEPRGDWGGNGEDVERSVGERGTANLVELILLDGETGPAIDKGIHII